MAPAAAWMSTTSRRAKPTRACQPAECECVRRSAAAACCHAAMRRCLHDREGSMLCACAAPSSSAREAVVAAGTGRVHTAQALIVMDQKTVTGRSERVFCIDLFQPSEESVLYLHSCPPTPRACPARTCTCDRAQRCALLLPWRLKCVGGAQKREGREAREQRRLGSVTAARVVCRARERTAR
jgi:hypothetical protein